MFKTSLPPRRETYIFETISHCRRGQLWLCCFFPGTMLPICRKAVGKKKNSLIFVALTYYTEINSFDEKYQFVQILFQLLLWQHFSVAIFFLQYIKLSAKLICNSFRSHIKIQKIISGIVCWLVSTSSYRILDRWFIMHSIIEMTSRSEGNW